MWQRLMPHIWENNATIRFRKPNVKRDYLTVNNKLRILNFDSVERLSVNEYLFVGIEEC